MARHRNVEWNLPEGTKDQDGTRRHEWGSIQISLLMDIRDELQTLNRLLACPNFTGIPRTLYDIRRNTARKRRKVDSNRVK